MASPLTTKFPLLQLIVRDSQRFLLRGSPQRFHLIGSLQWFHLIGSLQRFQLIGSLQWFHLIGSPQRFQLIGSPSDCELSVFLLNVTDGLMFWFEQLDG